MASFSFTYKADNGHVETHEAEAADQAAVVRMIYMILTRAVGNESRERMDRARALKNASLMEGSDYDITRKINDALDTMGGFPSPTPREKARLERRVFALQAELYRREAKKRQDALVQQAEARQAQRQLEEEGAQP